MTSKEHPVFVSIARAEGGVDQVRVGTALKTPEGFTLQLGELSIGAEPAPRAPIARRPTGGGEGVFPPYGRSKGAPIFGATVQDLEYYASGCRRTLDDPGKSRWHDKERTLLAAIEAELARQRGGEAPAGEPPPPGDEDVPF